jgi:hypothetical protein
MKYIILALLFSFTATASDFDIARKMSDLLTGIPGIKITSFGDDDCIVDGSVDSVEHMNRVLSVVDGLKPHPVHNLVTLSKKGREELKARIEEEIATEGVHVRIVNNVVMLEGIVRSDFEADRAVEIAKTFISAPAVPTLPTPRGTASVAHSGASEGQKSPGTVEIPAALYSRNNLPTMLADVLRVVPEAVVKKGKH